VGTGHEIVTGSGDFDLSDTLSDTNLGPNVHDGDTVVRWLIDWYLITSLHENSIALATQPLPWVAGVFFTPNPSAMTGEGDSFDLLSAEVGDAIYTERTKWVPTRWTDGTLNSTQWWAGSRGVVDLHPSRTFNDHSTDRIVFGFQSEDANFTSDPIRVTVGGWMHIKCLVSR
jgi:hypothetical protein